MARCQRNQQHPRTAETAHAQRLSRCNFNQKIPTMNAPRRWGRPCSTRRRRGAPPRGTWRPCGPSCSAPPTPAAGPQFVNTQRHTHECGSRRSARTGGSGAWCECGGVAAAWRQQRAEAVRDHRRWRSHAWARCAERSKAAKSAAAAAMHEPHRRRGARARCVRCFKPLSAAPTHDNPHQQHLCVRRTSNAIAVSKCYSTHLIQAGHLLRRRRRGRADAHALR
jgi:hypothetical protein